MIVRLTMSPEDAADARFLNERLRQAGFKRNRCARQAMHLIYKAVARAKMTAKKGSKPPAISYRFRLRVPLNDMQNT